MGQAKLPGPDYQAPGSPAFGERRTAVPCLDVQTYQATEMAVNLL